MHPVGWRSLLNAEIEGGIGRGAWVTLSKRRPLQEHFLAVFLVLVGTQLWQLVKDVVAGPYILGCSSLHAKLSPSIPQKRSCTSKNPSQSRFCSCFPPEAFSWDFPHCPSPGALLPSRDDPVLHALWSSKRDYPLEWQFQLFGGFVAEVEFPELQLSQIPQSIPL